MARLSSGRGRPKGTGVNDGARLEAVAKLLAANPEMRPTTAIKALGISDPSTIRRIREKFKTRQKLVSTANRAAVKAGAAAASSPRVVLRPAANPADPMSAAFTAVTGMVTAAFDINISALEYAFKNSVFLRAYDYDLKPGEPAVSKRKERRTVSGLRH